jgi:hypothetical protein
MPDDTYHMHMGAAAAQFIPWQPQPATAGCERVTHYPRPTNTKGTNR